eukprot:scaffold2910_cov390-Prasinococcus_capsulatus_cf.AAC.41
MKRPEKLHRSYSSSIESNNSSTGNSCNPELRSHSDRRCSARKPAPRCAAANRSAVCTRFGAN